jgi:hypothetical protein
MMKKGIDARRLAALEAIYAQVPAVACQRRCGVSCGPMILTDLEARRLQVMTHTKPRTLPLVTNEADLRCIYLAPDQRRCTVHAIRPLICRVWGVLKRLSCPFGCVPDRWLSDVEFVQLAQAVEQIGGGRVLRTSPEGLGHLPGEAFAQIDVSAALPGHEAEAERVRNLRALFGGRILNAIERRDADVARADHVLRTRPR